PAYSQTGPISKRLNYNLFLSSTIDALDQTVDGVAYPATTLQWFAQPSLSYQLSPHSTAAAGYAFVRHNLFDRVHTDENRLWGQVAFNHAAGRGRLAHRFRYEERHPFNRGNHRMSYATLGRYHVGYTLPLSKAKKWEKGWYLTASNEVFLCISGAQNGPIGQKNAFHGEDWMSAGLGYNTGKMGRVELGYMLQTLVWNPRQDLRFLHLVQVTWLTNFRLSGISDWFYTPTLFENRN
ncbi:MAG: DUF2490 domain-containing protein, partial [Cytophagaceae bacterium]|nr:DUF2490 domain-containing protein [Cytophagaceae bacterium]